jgi:ABC-type transporter Mla MlaB component
MTFGRNRRLDVRSAAATEVRGLAEPLASKSDAASAPLDDPPRTIRLRGSLERTDVATVCARASASFVALHVDTVACDVGGLVGPSMPAVEVLARLALCAHRNRQRMRLEHASPQLVELLALCGLAKVLAGRPDSG